MTEEKILEINLNPNVELYVYRCKILRVVDADTVDAELDLGFGIKMTQRFRINDYDAPETWRPKSEAERIHGHEATARATELLMGKEVFLKSSKIPGIYGRYGGTIWLDDGRDFKDVMISEGFAKRDSY
jgi:micrococcal nuclease